MQLAFFKVILNVKTHVLYIFDSFKLLLLVQFDISFGSNRIENLTFSLLNFFWFD